MINRIKTRLLNALRYFVIMLCAITEAFLPMRAYAFVPAVPLTTYLAAPAAGAALTETTATVGTMAVGTVFGGAVIVGGIALYCIATNCLKRPSTWTNGAPPGSIDFVRYYNLGDGEYADPQELCAVAFSGGYYLDGACINPATPKITYPVASRLRCPSGYYSNGAGCTLSDATQAKFSDPSIPCQYTVAGGVITADTSNSACASDTSSGPNKTVKADDGYSYNKPTSGNEIVGTNSAGGKLDVTCSSASCTVSQTIPGTDSSGAPATQNGKAITDPAGVVSGASQSTTAGTGTAASGTAANDSAAVSCTDLANCNWMTNTQGDKVASGVTQLHTDHVSLLDYLKSLFDPAETDPSSSPTDDQINNNINSLNDKINTASTAYSGPVSNFLRGIGFPIPKACSTLNVQYTLLGHTFTINFSPEGFCEVYQPIINWTTWGLLILQAFYMARNVSAADTKE